MEEARLQALLDKDEITQVLYRFCRGVDRCDADLIRGCFHPDGYDDHGNIKGTGDEVAIALTEGSRGYWDVSTHSLANCSIDFDGDVAHVETYVVSTNQREGSSGRITAVMGARYVDRFERRSGVWLIARRTVVVDWTFADKLGAWKGDFGQFVMGRRDREDVSYRR